MVNSSGLSRLLILYAVVIPLALLLGVLLAPADALTFLFVGFLFLVLVCPILLRWHHVLLLVFWNAFINVFFLPGQPPAWLLLASISFIIAVVNKTMDRSYAFLKAPLITRPLLFLLAVVVFTALYRGGLGSRVLGGAAYGGKGYIYLLGGIIGYFALTSQPISKRHATWLIAFFFLSPVTAIFSNLAYAAGPSFYFLFSLFPVNILNGQPQADLILGGSGIERIGGLSFGCGAIYYFLLLHYGIRGILDFSKPWRLLFFVAVIIGSMFGGFRSVVILLGLIFVSQFYWERLLRTRYLPLLLGITIIGGGLFVFEVEKMPLSIQRAVSFLPIHVNPLAREDALYSTDWRVEMWKLLVPEIPKYLLVGKGYSINPTDLYMEQYEVWQGSMKSNEAAITTGNYHNGPLSVILPLGLGGAIGVSWLLIAGIKGLYRNYRYGSPELHRINTFLLACFIARILFFITIFGAINTELFWFTGILGLSVSLNGGIAKSAGRMISQNPIIEQNQPEMAFQLGHAVTQRSRHEIV